MQQVKERALATVGADDAQVSLVYARPDERVDVPVLQVTDLKQQDL